MKFKVRHRIQNIAIAAYERLYFDETFNQALCAHVRLRRELLQRDVDDKGIVRVVRVGPDREIPAPAAKVLGGKRIEYTEHLQYQFGGYEGRWHTVSSLLSDKVDSRGSFRFESAEGGGVWRTVQGDITVKVFGFGAVAERFIVADIEKSYDNAAAFTQMWIDRGGVTAAAAKSA